MSRRGRVERIALRRGCRAMPAWRSSSQVKNRLHFDLAPDDQAGEVARLLALGARRIDIGQGTVPWVVLADPEGNEFCVLPPRT